MNPDASNGAAEPVDLSRVIAAMRAELRCLLGPEIELALGELPSGGTPLVHADPEDLVDLVRHLVLDAHDAMPGRGQVTIRTGRLRAATECAAMVIHEIPDAAPAGGDGQDRPIRKGRRLGLGASFDAIERAGGHFHVSCRGRETVVTICLPLAG